MFALLITILMKTVYILIVLLIAQQLYAQDIYHNKTFGISFKVPQNWLLGSVEGDIKNESITDVARTKLLNTGKSIYLVEYYYGPASLKHGLIPKFQINVVEKPQKTYSEYKKKFEESTKKLNKILDNFKIIIPPTETSVSGIKCMYFVMEYTMDVNGVVRSVRNKTYGIPYRNYLFHISLVDGEDQDKVKDFDAFINSIKISL